MRFVLLPLRECYNDFVLHIVYTVIVGLGLGLLLVPIP